MSTSGNRGCQWVSRSVFKDSTEDALTISGGSLSQNGTARIGDGAYSIAVGGTCGRGSVALFELDVRRWTSWGILGDH